MEILEGLFATIVFLTIVFVFGNNQYQCPTCGRHLSKNATVCPGCGETFRS